VKNISEGHRRTDLAGHHRAMHSISIARWWREDAKFLLLYSCVDSDHECDRLTDRQMDRIATVCSAIICNVAYTGTQ